MCICIYSFDLFVSVIISIWWNHSHDGFARFSHTYSGHEQIRFLHISTHIFEHGSCKRRLSLILHLYQTISYPRPLYVPRASTFIQPDFSSLTSAHEPQSQTSSSSSLPRLPILQSCLLPSRQLHRATSTRCPSATSPLDASPHRPLLSLEGAPRRSWA